eukprot:SAG31_NODE_14380_length_810_cov_0.942335_1_plen_149_part_00
MLLRPVCRRVASKHLPVAAENDASGFPRGGSRRSASEKKVALHSPALPRYAGCSALGNPEICEATARVLSLPTVCTIVSYRYFLYDWRQQVTISVPCPFQRFTRESSPLFKVTPFRPAAIRMLFFAARRALRSSDYHPCHYSQIHRHL